MTCPTEDLTVSQDASWQMSKWLVDGNQPVDLTTRRVELHILPSFGYAGGAIAILTSLANGGIAVNNASKGSITVSMSQTAVAAMPVGRWVYYLRVVNGAADTVEYARGNFTILAGATA